MLWIVNKPIRASWLKVKFVLNEAAARLFVENIAVYGVWERKSITLLLTKDIIVMFVVVL